MGRTKDGNKMIRWILIQGANPAARKDDRVRDSIYGWLKDMIIILR